MALCFLYRLTIIYLRKTGEKRMKNELIEKLLSDVEKDLLAAKDYLKKLQRYLDNPKELERSNYLKWEVEDKIEGAAEDVEELDQMVELLKELKSYKDIGTVEEFKAFKEKEIEKTPLYPKEIDGYRLYGTCPTCGTSISTSNNSERCHCGQKLNWLNCEV
jgi:rubrerythrin